MEWQMGKKNIVAPALISAWIEIHQFDELSETKEILSIDVKEWEYT